jgi:hypothetical protein
MKKYTLPNLSSSSLQEKLFLSSVSFMVEPYWHNEFVLPETRRRGNLIMQCSQSATVFFRETRFDEQRAINFSEDQAQTVRQA